MLLGAGVDGAVAPAAAGSGCVTGAGPRRPASSPTTRPVQRRRPMADHFTQPATLPAYERAIDHLNATHPGTRVLAIPGNDFAAYRWGDTIDTASARPADPALRHPRAADHGLAAHGRRPLRPRRADPGRAPRTGRPGPDGPADERRGPAGRVRPGLRALRHAPAPARCAQTSPPTPAGLSDPVVLRARRRPNVSPISTLDEQDLAAPANPAWPVAAGHLHRARPAAHRPGRVDTGAAGGGRRRDRARRHLAGAGLLEHHTPSTTPAPWTPSRPSSSRLLASGRDLVVTDTNRKQAFRWDTIAANTGYTETPARTRPQPTRATARSTSSPARRPTPDHRRLHGAVDGHRLLLRQHDHLHSPRTGPPAPSTATLDTAWETGTFVADPRASGGRSHFAHAGDHRPRHPRPAPDGARRPVDHQGHPDLRRRPPGHRSLGPASRTAGGQIITFPARTFPTLRITIDATSDDHASPATAAPVGFAEVARSPASTSSRSSRCPTTSCPRPGPPRSTTASPSS